MQNNIKLTLSTGSGRHAVFWYPQELYWADFIQKVSSPVVTAENFTAYKRLPKKQQDNLKDVGGFVGGRLAENRRKNDKVIDRSLITLDADSVPSGGTQAVLQAVSALGCAYVVYSTRKHEEAAPRLRIVIPLDKPCTAEQYEPIARKVASYIGMEIMDPSTFEASRLMYWPSVSADMPQQYVFAYEDKPFLSGEGVLAQYTNWQDVAEWPEVPGTAKVRQTAAKRQGNPLDKKGVVGAFCRTYDVPAAITKFIPDAYNPCDTPGRYSYAEGSTVGGAVLYDGGNFIFSHHATDPISGLLCNAFDLIRLHKFGHLDEDAKPETPVASLPSYREMRSFCVEDPEVKALLSTERYEQAVTEFDGIEVTDAVEDPRAWMGLLKFNENGQYLKTIENILTVLEHDPLIRDRFYHDEFSNRPVVCGVFPWENGNAYKGERPWENVDDAGLRWYMETVYKITGKERIYDAMALYAKKHSRHKIKEYLSALRWDGVPRIDTLLIDYFGAEDSVYTREAMRKALVAAVARAMAPGTKFDTMLILSGAQGIGKSTFLRILGKEWFSDSLTTFDGKEASELVQGYWIIEVGELAGFNRSEMNAVKQFLSKLEDVYRVPYERRTAAFPRSCVFFGTTNDATFLRDQTGGRRFWPVDLGKGKPTKSVFTDLEQEADQIWAEACMRYIIGEPLFLSGETDKLAKIAQEEHREVDPKEGIVTEFVFRKVPLDWQKMDLAARRTYWATEWSKAAEEKLVERDRICAVEVWSECFNNPPGTMRRSDAVSLNAILANISEFEKCKSNRRFGPSYGQQRGYIRRELSTDAVNNDNNENRKS